MTSCLHRKTRPVAPASNDGAYMECVDCGSLAKWVAPRPKAEPSPARVGILVMDEELFHRGEMKEFIASGYRVIESRRDVTVFGQIKVLLQGPGFEPVHRGQLIPQYVLTFTIDQGVRSFSLQKAA